MVDENLRDKPKQIMKRDLEEYWSIIGSFRTTTSTTTTTKTTKTKTEEKDEQHQGSQQQQIQTNLRISTDHLKTWKK